MLKTPILTQDQISRFRKDRYLLVRGAFDAAEAGAIEQWTTELSKRPEEPGKHWVYHEESVLGDGADLINRIENMTPFDAGFAELAQVLAPPVGHLLGESAVLFKDKINFKMPGGDGFKPHQDLQAGWEDYASYFISVMVCIDEATIQNGCLNLAALDRAAMKKNRHLGRNWVPLTAAETAGLDFEPCPTEPGDIVFFDSFAPHASEPNLTETTRRLYFATFNRRSEGDHLARYYADKHKNYPPDIEREPGREYVYRV